MSTDGDLVLDRRAHVVTRDGDELALTAREFALLDWFLTHPGRRASPRRAHASGVGLGVRRRVHGDRPCPPAAGEGGGRAVEQRRLVTVFGVGYRWDAQPSEERLMPTQLSAVGLAAGVTLVVGLLGVALVVALARRSVGTAAIAAPVVVVLAVAAGVYASSRAMFLQPADSTTVLLGLLAAVPVAAVLGVLVAKADHRCRPVGAGGPDGT